MARISFILCGLRGLSDFGLDRELERSLPCIISEIITPLTRQATPAEVSKAPVQVARVVTAASVPTVKTLEDPTSNSEDYKGQTCIEQKTCAHGFMSKRQSELLSCNRGNS